MSDETELKPCPFCGAAQVTLSMGRVSRLGYHGPIWKAFCLGCNAQSGNFDEDNKAAAAWNRRTA